MVRIGSMTYFQDIEWYDNLVDCKAKGEALEFKRSHELSLGSSMISVEQFRKWVKQCFYDFHDLEPSLLIRLSDYWWKINDPNNMPSICWKEFAPRGPFANGYTRDSNPWMNKSINKLNQEENVGPRTNSDQYNETSDDASIGNILNGSNEIKGIHPECTIRRFEVLEYHFVSGNKFKGNFELNHQVLYCEAHTYNDIFRKMDEG